MLFHFSLCTDLFFQYLLQPKYKLEEKARRAVGLGACSEIKENTLYSVKKNFGLQMYSETECIYRFLSNIYSLSLNIYGLAVITAHS